MSSAIHEPTQEDVPHLHDLIRAHAAFERSAATLTQGELSALVLGSSRPIRFLVAKREDELAGYAAVTFDWSVWRARRYAHLECLFVAEASRGQGHGARLLASAQAVALAEGADRMEWQTPAWNVDASRFYSRKGAETEAKTRFTLHL
ncbi:GNAT family N-acetyltransferase [Aureimonas sp. N4]|uniref:GNAT family N-acetyltransferase n=1 Tax=Aureimonas sp. N4 TaxID=1638165 RepID=UPI000781070C|nr:GNAT family N-acetyltransferase [Aureimonas sp. N4]